MARQFVEDTLIIASHNKGKIREISDLLLPFKVTVKSGPSFGFEEPEETGSTFVANAEIKSQFFAEETKLPSLSDDSGLVIPALDGEPGIYSARWAGESKDFAVAMKRVQSELLARTGTDTGHKAYFVCVLSLTWPDGHSESFEGRVDGTLTFPAKGDKGFGYDPIFIADGENITFAEMDPVIKHSISHRADAFTQLISACFADIKTS